MNLKSFFGPSLAKWRGITAGSARQDLLAGLSVAAVALPVGLAYATMMGLPAASGLWAAIAGMLAYAFFGTSRTLIVGPDTATCTLIAATLTGLSIVEPEARLAAAAGMAVVVGLGCLLARLFRLGVLANLLSRPVLVGYMAGVAVTLAWSQLGTLTGAGPRPADLLRPFEAVTRLLTQAHLPPWPWASCAAPRWPRSVSGGRAGPGPSSWWARPARCPGCWIFPATALPWWATSRRACPASGCRMISAMCRALCWARAACCW